MAFIVTPAQFHQRSEFYHQLGSMLDAGLPVYRTLEQLRLSPPHRSMRPLIERLIAHVQEGYTFTESLRRSGDWIPSFDISLFEAGEKSGRLPACCKLLADYYRQRAQLTKDVISNLLYPVFVFHFAVFIFPISYLTNLVLHDGLLPFFLQKIAILAPIYAALIFLVFACQGKRGDHWRATVEKFLHMVPILGMARRHLALARLSASLEALITAGVPIYEAWSLGASASGSAALRSAVEKWQAQIPSGTTPSELLRESPVFPEMFANLYHTGEVSGQQDSTLKRLHQYYQEDGSGKLRLFCQWLPRLVYALVAVAVGYQVVQFYSGYFNTINTLTR